MDNYLENIFLVKWGGANLAPAFNINVFNPTLADDLTAPAVNSILMGRDANYSSFQAIGSTLDIGNFSSRLWVDIFSNGQPVGSANPIPVNAASNDQRQSYVTADTTPFNYAFPCRALSAFVAVDDPTSIGLVFSADLLFSPDGGTTWRVLKNFTQADVLGLPYVVPEVPLNFYGVRVNSLTLGSTATRLDFSTFAVSL